MVYCLLRLVVDHSDGLALRTWLGLQNGLGSNAIKGLREFCLNYSLSVWDALLLISGSPAQLPKHGRKFKSHFDRLQHLLEQLGELDSLTEIIDFSLEQVGFTVAEEAELREFFEKILEDKHVNGLSELVLTLQTLDLQAESFLENDAVRIMTMHKAKGLSSELVIIPALEDDLMPGRYDEELARRMIYVSLTRSRNYLFMTHALSRSGSQSYLGHGGGQSQKQRSRFLHEMNIRSVSGGNFRITVYPFPVVIVADQKSLNSSILRRLLTEAFSDEELEDLAFDYCIDVYNEFGSGMSKKAKIS